MEEKNLSQKVEESFDFINKVKEGKIKVRELKIPRKAKVSRMKQKKGYIGIIRVDENLNMTGEKVKLEESSVQLKGGTFHATDGQEICRWNGKYPVVIIPTWSKNPINLKELKPNNETYGQKYIMAKMLKAVIVATKKKGSFLIWIIIAIAAIIGYSLITKGGA